MRRDLGVRCVLAELQGAGEGGGHDVEVGEHHPLGLPQQGVPEGRQPGEGLAYHLRFGMLYQVAFIL